MYRGDDGSEVPSSGIPFRSCGNIEDDWWVLQFEDLIHTERPDTGIVVVGGFDNDLWKGRKQFLRTLNSKMKSRPEELSFSEPKI